MGSQAPVKQPSPPRKRPGPYVAILEKRLAELLEEMEVAESIHVRLMNQLRYEAKCMRNELDELKGTQ